MTNIFKSNNTMTLCKISFWVSLFMFPWTRQRISFWVPIVLVQKVHKKLIMFKSIGIAVGHWQFYKVKELIS